MEQGGGSRHPENLQLLCRAHNSIEAEWTCLRQGFLLHGLEADRLPNL
jgi:hypothetical protein